MISFGSAPSSSSALAASVRPARMANRNGVKPPFERTFTSAPASTRARTTSVLFSAAAHISALWPRSGSFALTSAPRASRARTAATRPVRAAVISAVSPSGSVVFTSAPEASRRSMMAALPLIAAAMIGVTP